VPGIDRLRDGCGVLLGSDDAPTVRAALGGLLARAATADFAVARIRLGALDLSLAEVAHVKRCRVLLGRLEAGSFALGARGREDFPGDWPASLLVFARSGRLEVRTAPGDSWMPDFSVFVGLAPRLRVPDGAVTLLGAHYFAPPFPVAGPAFTAAVPGAAAADAARDRFEDLWSHGYDVLPVVAEAVERLVAAVEADPVTGRRNLLAHAGTGGG